MLGLQSGHHALRGIQGALGAGGGCHGEARPLIEGLVDLEGGGEFGAKRLFIGRGAVVGLVPCQRPFIAV